MSTPPNVSGEPMPLLQPGEQPFGPMTAIEIAIHEALQNASVSVLEQFYSPAGETLPPPTLALYVEAAACDALMRDFRIMAFFPNPYVRAALGRSLAREAVVMARKYWVPDPQGLNRQEIAANPGELPS